MPLRVFLSASYTSKTINSFPLYRYLYLVLNLAIHAPIITQSLSTAYPFLCLVVKTKVNCFIICIVNVSFLSCPRMRVYVRPHVGEEKSPEFRKGQRLMSFSLGNSTAVLMYRSTHYRTWVSIKQFPHTIIRLSEDRFQDVLYHHTIPVTF